MQDQVRQAMELGLKAAASEGAPAPNASKQPGGRILAAMFKANAGACDCEPCRLLKQEVQTLFASFLEAGEEAADPHPADQPAAAVTGAVESPANA